MEIAVETKYIKPGNGALWDPLKAADMRNFTPCEGMVDLLKAYHDYILGMGCFKRRSLPEEISNLAFRCRLYLSNFRSPNTIEKLTQEF